MNQELFTPNYFAKTVIEFRELFGRKDFRSKPEQERQRAVTALGHVAFNTNHGNDGKPITRADSNSVMELFNSTVNEYARREMYLINGIGFTR